MYIYVYYIYIYIYIYIYLYILKICRIRRISIQGKCIVVIKTESIEN